MAGGELLEAGSTEDDGGGEGGGHNLSNAPTPSASSRSVVRVVRLPRLFVDLCALVASTSLLDCKRSSCRALMALSESAPDV